MRTMTCECGHTLTADNDEELLVQARRHVESDHPEMGISDDQLRELVAANAHDA